MTANFLKFTKRYGINYSEKNPFLDSTPWYISCEYYNYYGDPITEEHDYTPEEFDFLEFMELLLSIDNNISIILYKYLFSTCCYVKEIHSDNEPSKAFYRCDIEDLYEKLIKFKVITEETN